MAIGDPYIMQGQSTGITQTPNVSLGADPLDMLNKARAERGLSIIDPKNFDIQGPFGGSFSPMAEQALEIGKSTGAYEDVSPIGDLLRELNAPATPQQQTISPFLRDDPTLIDIFEDAGSTVSQPAEGFYGQSEVRGTEAGPPEFGQEEVQQDQDTTGAPTAEQAQPDTAGPKGYQRKKGVDNSAKEAVQTAMDEYLKLARPGVEPGTYEDYIKEFGEATGLDVSGEPDNKMALMAFGLALMQNKAGKGFDVGEMLSSVGEAGEKAMPALQKAREQAQAIRAKAGEYAISRKKEDQAAAMAREGYYIVPRGEGGVSGLVKNFDKGRLTRLNSYELNNLDTNEDFNKEYEIIPVSMYETMVENLTKEPEYGNKYASSYSDISLFTDAPEDLRISVQRVDGNYKGPDAAPHGRFNLAEYDIYYNRLASMDRDLDKFANQIGEAFSITDSGAVTMPGQIGDSITSFGNALGLNLSDQATETDKVKYILNSIAAKKAPAILGEAGKTISDGDRERVREIVGALGMTTDPEALKLALTEVYDLIVVTGKKDVQQGIQTLNFYANKGSAPQQGQQTLKPTQNESGEEIYVMQ
jgi:hypothetical protein